MNMVLTRNDLACLKLFLKRRLIAAQDIKHILTFIEYKLIFYDTYVITWEEYNLLVGFFPDEFKILSKNIAFYSNKEKEIAYFVI